MPPPSIQCSWAPHALNLPIWLYQKHGCPFHQTGLHSLAVLTVTNFLCLSPPNCAWMLGGLLAKEEHKAQILILSSSNIFVHSNWWKRYSSIKNFSSHWAFVTKHWIAISSPIQQRRAPERRGVARLLLCLGMWNAPFSLFPRLWLSVYSGNIFLESLVLGQRTWFPSKLLL